MADRKLVLLCAASAAAGAVLASGLTAAAVREGVQPPPEPPARRQSAPQAAYTLGEWEGRLAVYRDGEEEPEQVLEVYLNLLPPADAAALREGIPVADEEERARRLEDFAS